MLDYKFYYWDAPFRGNFVQLLLEEVNAKYERCDASEIYPDRRWKIVTPGMAPPYLYDCRKKTYLAQMPAILMTLAEKYGTLPKRTDLRALALKTILDSNDVLLEITNYHGESMWTQSKWNQFRSGRLADWMMIFEKTGRQHGLTKDKGFLLGTRFSVADIAATALFGTMIYCLPELETDLKKKAPAIHGLCHRIETRPRIKAFLARQREEYGFVYCGGQIERSIREALS